MLCFYKVFLNRCSNNWDVASLCDRCVLAFTQAACTPSLSLFLDELFVRQRQCSLPSSLPALLLVMSQTRITAFKVSVLGSVHQLQTVLPHWAGFCPFGLLLNLLGW